MPPCDALLVGSKRATSPLTGDNWNTDNLTQYPRWTAVREVYHTGPYSYSGRYHGDVGILRYNVYYIIVTMYNPSQSCQSGKIA